MPPTNLLGDNYWSGRYQRNETGWDIGEASTPLKQYISQLNDKTISILIPGCGNAYEADYLAEAGFSEITLLDISHTVVESLQNHFENKSVTVLHQDFFDHVGQYDLIMEQTFFCALAPEKRKDYALKMFELLKPAGTLAGVLFNRNFEGGPPFGGSRNEYKKLFSPLFHLHAMEDCYNSIAPRQGSELWINIRKMT